MEISRLSFTKETKEKMSKELNKRQKGELRWKRLKEADTNGELAFVKNRYEVAKLCGFTESQKKTGHSWVTNKVRHGQLQEVLVDIGKNGKMEYEYHILADPDYGFKGVKDTRRKEREQIAGKDRMVTHTEPMVQINKMPIDNLAVYKVEVIRGDTTIKVELANYAEVSEFVKTILKGE